MVDGVAAADPAFDKRFDTRAFRDALGAFVTGVTIVTTLDEAGSPAGLTANSFNSVSLDPPLVLWSLALESTSFAAFRHARWWAVHVLAAGQEDLSDRFARRDAEKFEGVAFSAGPGGVPLLEGCSARFVCRAAFEHEGGDHAIFIGEVESFEQSGSAPLVYHQGRYGAVLPRAKTAAGAREQAGLLLLAEQGLVNGAQGQRRLSDAGRELAGGLAALAEERALAAHEVSALRHLVDRL